MQESKMQTGRSIWEYVYVYIYTYILSSIWKTMGERVVGFYSQPLQMRGWHRLLLMMWEFSLKSCNLPSKSFVFLYMIGCVGYVTTQQYTQHNTAVYTRQPRGIHKTTQQYNWMFCCSVVRLVGWLVGWFVWLVWLVCLFVCWFGLVRLG